MKKLLLTLAIFCVGAFASSQEFTNFNLIRFAYIGDLAKVQKAMKMGAKIDARDDEGSNALLWAAYKDRADVVKYLIEHGADKTVRSSSGKNILIYAVQNKNAELVKYLLAQKVPYESFSKNEDALYEATQDGSMEIVKLLLPYIKDVNQYYTTNADSTTWRTDTTLLLASINAKNSDLARVFIAQGADINKPNSKNETPLLCAMRNRMYELANELISKGAKLDDSDIAGNTVLSYAIKAKQTNIALKALPKSNLFVLLSSIVAKDEPEKKENFVFAFKPKELEYTYLHMAAMYGEVEVARELLKSGAKIDTLTNTKSLSLDALGVAALHGNAQMVELLINSGANPYRVYKNSHAQGEVGLMYFAGGFDEYTLLDLATISITKSEQTLNPILNQKDAPKYAKLENKVFYKNLALALYSDGKKEKNLELVESKLLQWDSERYVSARDEIIALLDKQRKKQDTKDKAKTTSDTIREAIEKGDLATLQEIQKSGISIAKELPEALSSALIHGQKQLVIPLVDMGVDPNYLWHDSPLSQTVMLYLQTPKELREMFEALLQRGMNPNANGSALLHYIKEKREYDKELIAMMISHGADFGKVPYKIASLFEDESQRALKYIQSDKVLYSVFVDSLRKSDATEIALAICSSKEITGEPRYADGVEKLFEIAYKEGIKIKHQNIFELKKATIQLQRSAMFYMEYEGW